jgi:hypothetical protein
MRKLFAISFLCYCTLLWTGEARSANPARALVDKAIMAAGGEANLKKHQAQTWNEKGTYYGMGDGLPYTSKLAMQFPGQFRMAVSSGGMDIFTLVLDKDKGWMKDDAGKVREMTKDELKNQQSDTKAGWIASLLPLKDKAFVLESIPGVQVGKKPTAGVSVTRADYPTVKLYFDKESGLLVKSEYEAFSGEKKRKVLTEIIYQNFKLIDGAQMPTHIIVNHDGKVYVEADILDLKAEGKLEAKVFDAPQ